MTHDDLTPSNELASAAFDGEVTPDERARVAGDATLSAEAASYARIRAQLNDVRVPAPTRDIAIAAALAAFDQARGTTLAPTVVSLVDRRKRQQRWLMGAAAAAIAAIVVAGVVNSSTTDYKSSSQSLGTSAQDSQSGGAAPAKVATAAAGTTGGVTAGTAAGAGAATDTAGQINAIPGPAVVTPWALAPTFTTANELAAFAVDPAFGQNTAASTAAPAESSATKAATAYDVATAYSTTCLNGVTTPFAAIVFQGQQVLAIRDATGKSLKVIDPRTCNTVITISLR